MIPIVLGQGLCRLFSSMLGEARHPGGGGGSCRIDPYCLDQHNLPLMERQKWWAAAWRTFRRRSTLRHAVKNKRVTVQGPAKKPPMDFMSHRGGDSAGCRMYPSPPPWRR